MNLTDARAVIEDMAGPCDFVTHPDFPHRYLCRTHDHDAWNQERCPVGDLADAARSLLAKVEAVEAVEAQVAEWKSIAARPVAGPMYDWCATHAAQMDAALSKGDE